MSSALPPSNTAPSIRPSKSMITRSPVWLGRGSAGASYSWKRLAKRSSAPAIVSSPTSATRRVSSIFLRSTSGTSGSTSSAMVNSRSAPSSNEVTSILGRSAGRSSWSAIAFCDPRLTACSSTSPITERPYCLRSRAIGTLPGRKPGMRMRPFSSSSRWATWPAISAASTTTLYSRFRPSADNSVTCISLRLAFRLQRAGPGDSRATLVRAKGLEPPRPCSHEDLNLARLPIPPRPPDVRGAPGTSRAPIT